MKYKMFKFKTKLVDTVLWYVCLFYNFQLQKIVQGDPLQIVDEDY